MKRYEGLFILNTAGKEEGVKDVIDKISGDITAAGGKVEAVQKLDKRAFARVTDKKMSSGFYVNFIFDVPPAALTPLRLKFSLNQDVYRALFNLAPAPVKAVK